MSVVLSMAEVGPCRRELKLEVPAPEVESETRRVVDAIRRRAQVPGFRKGKVPPRIIEKRYKEEVEHEVLDRLLPRFWQAAQAETGIDPLLPPRVSDVELQPGAPLTFTATVEVRPAIELGDLENFDLPEPDAEPTGEEVAAALDDLRHAWATWRPVERTAARGDLVEAHITELGEAEEDAAAHPARPVRFEVGHSSVWEELSLAVTGQAAGQTVEFTRRQEGEPEQRFRVAIDAVKEQELPELDDELAQRTGRFDDLAALREDVRRQLREGKQAEADRRRQQALLDQLRQRHPVELPRWVVESELEGLLHDYAGELARQGVDVERAEIDWNQLAAQVEPQAERRVHSRLLLDAVAEARAIEVDDAELEAAVAALARARRQPAAAFRRELVEAGKLISLRAQIRRDKAVRHLLGEPDPAPAAAAELAGGGGEPEGETPGGEGGEERHA